MRLKYSSAEGNAAVTAKIDLSFAASSISSSFAVHARPPAAANSYPPPRRSAALSLYPGAAVLSIVEAPSSSAYLANEPSQVFKTLVSHSPTDVAETVCAPTSPAEGTSFP
ncbi:hypothetical protein CERZMDRAFT_85695 [Cercospora zeae-maydis SCOH1-5]|uniref:Uncharacterized protein n=1 Tax=Cercospora zeae-maydis SCOH1-5 TaxID=717836 RepID=A0A6A6FCD3_9PEZI|nr:hypothetical protein CERZMDRAFT_85695 [Cercospora zeae-maydis SCOH1-5]